MPNALRESPPLPPEDERLVEAYSALGRPSDELPYSPEFSALVARLRGQGDYRTEEQILKRIFTLRKAARLPRARYASAALSEVSAEDIQLVEELLRQHLGAVGSRDQLPYSADFDQLWQQYRSRVPRPLDRHDFWRLVARISK